MTNIVVPQIGHCHVAQVAEEGLGGAGAAESAARSCRHNEAVGEKAEVSRVSDDEIVPVVSVSVGSGAAGPLPCTTVLLLSFTVPGRVLR